MIAALLLAGALIVAPHRATATVATEGSCAATLDGKPFPDGSDDREAAAALKEMASGQRRVVVILTGSAPYRCIGAALYRLQMAGYQLSFSPVAAPAR